MQTNLTRVSHKHFCECIDLLVCQIRWCHDIIKRKYAGIMKAKTFQTIQWNNRETVTRNLVRFLIERNYQLMQINSNMYVKCFFRREKKMFVHLSCKAIESVGDRTGRTNDLKPALIVILFMMFSDQRKNSLPRVNSKAIRSFFFVN